MDRPEWFFAHQLSRIREHTAFIVDDVTPSAMMVAAAMDRDVVPPIVQFVGGLASMCSEKVMSDYAEILKSPIYAVEGEQGGGSRVRHTSVICNFMLSDRFPTLFPTHSHFVAQLEPQHEMRRIKKNQIPNSIH